MRNLDNIRQAVESPKSWNSVGYICPQNIFLQLKHIQRIYLTLLSTISVKIHQIAYVIFETIIHFSRDNSSVLSQTLHNFDKNISSKCKYSDFPLLKLKFIKFLMSFFKQEVSFSSKLLHFFSWKFICYWQG